MPYDENSIYGEDYRPRLISFVISIPVMIFLGIILVVTSPIWLYNDCSLKKERQEIIEGGE